MSESEYLDRFDEHWVFEMTNGEQFTIGVRGTLCYVLTATALMEIAPDMAMRAGTALTTAAFRGSFKAATLVEEGNEGDGHIVIARRTQKPLTWPGSPSLVRCDCIAGSAHHVPTLPSVGQGGGGNNRAIKVCPECGAFGGGGHGGNCLRGM